MNRPIKFRAWVNKCKDRDGTMTIPFLLNETYIDDDSGNMVVDAGGYGMELYQDKYGGHVIMQFTGLLDKNGKEIYEGDMVKTKRNAVYAVEWTSFEDSTMGYGEGVGFNIHEDDNCEVIGNIYENPNLLPHD